MESVANSALPLETSVETQTMKENKSSSLGQKQEHIELSKITVIALIISLQIMYVLYTDGNAMGLDVLASMGLVAVIGSYGYVYKNHLHHHRLYPNTPSWRRYCQFLFHLSLLKIPIMIW